MNIKPICLSIKDTCSASGLGRTKIYEFINSGILKTSVVGGRRLVRYDSLDQLLSGENNKQDQLDAN